MSIVNRYRITSAEQHLKVQHPGNRLHWCRLVLDPICPDEHPGRPRPARQPESRLPLAQRCAAATFLHVNVNEFYDDLVRGGPGHSSPVFPVPGIEEVSVTATPRPGSRPITSSTMADIATVAIVAVVLAWRSGEARDYELEDDLTRVLGDRTSSKTARYVALSRSGGNIERVDGRWSMRRTWARPAPSR